MASGYMYGALDFYNKYLALSHAHLSRSLEEERKISKCRGIVLMQGWAKPKTLGRSKVLHIHNYNL